MSAIPLEWKELRGRGEKGDGEDGRREGERGGGGWEEGRRKERGRMGGGEGEGGSVADIIIHHILSFLLISQMTRVVPTVGGLVTGSQSVLS